MSFQHRAATSNKNRTEQDRIALEFCVQDELGVIALLQEARSQRLLRTRGLNTSQFALLFLLGKDPEEQWTLMRLADYLAMQPPGISKMVSQLKDKGWLTTKIDKIDKRKRFIQLTPEGENVRKETTTAVTPAICAMFENWGDEELAIFLIQLNKLRGWLHNEQER
jgi:DNA-binding MarR family transcriptional regulator